MRHRISTLALSLVAFLLLGADRPGAQSADEKLLVELPKGFKIGFQTKNELRLMMEYVPRDETLENWSEMVTVQVFYKMASMPPKSFERQMLVLMKKSCPTAEGAHVVDGVENGYPFSLWIQQFCPYPVTGKSETTHFKAIQGNSALYVVQKAFKADLTKERTVEVAVYLRSVRVCDPRNAKNPCPGPKQPRSATELPI